jgi:hypothetical protein
MLLSMARVVRGEAGQHSRHDALLNSGVGTGAAQMRVPRFRLGLLAPRRRGRCGRRT